MNALERNRCTEAWRAFGAAVPRPRAILMVSAQPAPRPHPSVVPADETNM